MRINHVDRSSLLNATKNLRNFGRDITNIERGNKNKSMNCLKDNKSRPISRNNSISKENFKDLWKQKQQKKLTPFAAKIEDPIKQYPQEILKQMLKKEKKNSNQISGEITQKMRLILYDWLIDVSESFQLKDQTLQLALLYLNQYSSKEIITKQEYQLVGITCLWIASKYQEIYPPRMKNYVEVTASTYSIDELKKMEGKIICKLNFNLVRTTALELMKTVTFFQKVQKKTLALSQYMIEMAMLNGQIPKNFLPSTMASAALLIAENANKNHPKIERPDQFPSSNSLQVQECSKQMGALWKSDKKQSVMALKRKFGRSRFERVSECSH